MKNKENHMKELPHQELRNQYYEEKKTDDKAWRHWEYYSPFYKSWENCWEDPAFTEANEYRRKPRFIEINGFQVPEPYRGDMNVGQVYFFPFFYGKNLVRECNWWNNGDDLLIQKSGLLHLDRGVAIIHSKAILSFTNPEIKP